jgi:hypothetical protein
MSPKFTQEEQERVLRSLNRVGPDKAIAYLPLYTIRDILHLAPEALIAEAISRNLAAVAIGPDRSCIQSGALYVYHREALAQRLRKSAAMLTSHQLAIDPDRFVQQIAATWFEREHPVYPVIAASFGDPI